MRPNTEDFENAIIDGYAAVKESFAELDGKPIRSIVLLATYDVEEDGEPNVRGMCTATGLQDDQITMLKRFTQDLPANLQMGLAMAILERHTKIIKMNVEPFKKEE